MKTLINLLVLSWGLLMAGSLSLAQAQTVNRSERPNVIIILSDDQGYGDFSAHGNPVLKTPNLDKLRGESVRFSDFHVAPMCTPTRGQLMTGVDALRNGATSVTAGRSYIKRGIPLMPEIFKANRYSTAIFGKWHLGDSFPNWPHQRGFDEAVHHMGWGINSIADGWLNDNFDDWYRHNGKSEQYKGYCTDVWFDLSMNWMKERAAKKEPFFLYLPTNAPHGPLWVPNKYSQPYQGKGPAAFFGMIANLDENIGRLESFLQASGLRDNTIVIFFNDNGGTAGVKTFNAGMRGQKTTNYEGGHRAALFVRWPNGKLRAPADVETPTQVQDILPTLIELLKLKKPANAKFDGQSISNLLRDSLQPLPDRKFVVQYGQTPKKWDGAVIWNKWRLVNGDELYDLKTDPAQEKNVAAQQPEIFQQMRQHYEQWWAGVAPRLTDFYHVSIGARQENPVTLTAVDWADVYCDNVVNCVRPGQNRNGVWHVQVEQSGVYEIALRRWPKEADAAITAGVPEFKIENRTSPAGVALPVAKARLKVGESDESKAVGGADKEVTFNVRLKAGAKLQMQSWFVDANGKELCGAYYAYVLKK
ncbi:MAG: arylsulfatase [Blastocatellia bacterium]